MVLADTTKSIGAVTRVLRDHLYSHLQSLGILTISDGISAVNVGPIADVSVGKPEPPQNGSVTNPRVNLFLYEIQFDSHLKNQPLDEGQAPPLWLVLKYIMTAFDDSGDSDSIAAQMLLGAGMSALQQIAFLPLGTASILGALIDNPEKLKLTFDQTSSDLLSKLMQGSDEKYRCSVGFEIRPVMIATREPPSYSLLVGVKYQPTEKTGPQINVSPNMGVSISTIYPEKFEPDSTLTITGTNLNLSNLSVCLGIVELSIMPLSPEALQCQIDSHIIDGSTISAGSHPISVVESLPNGRRRSSNLLIAHLLPVLTSVHLTPSDNPDIQVNLDLEGLLLGTVNDDVFVALYQNNKIVRVFDRLIAIPPPPPVLPQTKRRVQIPVTDAVPSGTYRVILRVNGEQAKNSPEVTIL